MQLKDALFNWLQIQVVQDARPRIVLHGTPCSFLRKCCGKITAWKIWKREKKKTGMWFVIRWMEKKRGDFPKDTAEQLLRDIMAEPKYNQVFED